MWWQEGRANNLLARAGIDAPKGIRGRAGRGWASASPKRDREPAAAAFRPGDIAAAACQDGVRIEENAVLREILQRMRRGLCIAAPILLSTMFFPAAAGAAELLMFEQRACAFCDAFNREIAPDYPRSRAGAAAPLRHVDIWKSRTAGIDGLDPAVFTPTFVLVDQGREVGRLLGYPGRRYFYPEIDKLIARLPAAPALD